MSQSEKSLASVSVGKGNWRYCHFVMIYMSALFSQWIDVSKHGLPDRWAAEFFMIDSEALFWTGLEARLKGEILPSKTYYSSVISDRSMLLSSICLFHYCKKSDYSYHNSQLKKDPWPSFLKKELRIKDTIIGFYDNMGPVFPTRFEQAGFYLE